MGNGLASVEDPPEEGVTAMREALGDEEPLLRERAAWAMNERE